LLLIATQAGAVIIDIGDGTGHTSAPSDDPGWANVGIVNGATAVYIGDNWVLSAKHVGFGATTFEGVTYTPVPGTYTKIENIDLGMWQIYGNPRLPALWISEEGAMVGDEVLMVGHGKNRGAPTSCDGHDGYHWGAGNTMRWGEEEVMLVKPGKWMATEFQPDGSAAANGDSGGAVFIKVDGEWELTGNKAFAVDLATYKQEIEEVIALPELSQNQQMVIGVLFLLVIRLCLPRNRVSEEAITRN